MAGSYVRHRQNVELMRAFTSQADVISDNIASVVEKEYLTLPASRLPLDVAVTHHSCRRITTPDTLVQSTLAESHRPVDRRRLANTSPDQLQVGTHNIKPTLSLLKISDDLFIRNPRAASALSDVSRYVKRQDKRLQSSWAIDKCARTSNAAGTVGITGCRHTYNAYMSSCATENRQHGTERAIHNRLSSDRVSQHGSMSTHRQQCSDHSALWLTTPG